MRTPVAGSDDPRVWCDPVNGLTTNDGLSQAYPVKHPQHALDIAAYSFELIPPFVWTPSPGHDSGVVKGIKIKLMASPAGACVFDNPLYIDGLGACGPVTLEGDPANPMGTFLRANNTFQGITAQNGARLRLQHLAIDSKENCTLINGLRRGIIEVHEGVWLGPSFNGGKNAPMGAAGASCLEIHSTVSMWGSGFWAILVAIESGQIILTTMAGFFLSNAMDYGSFLGLQRAECWTQGVPPSFTGAWAASAAAFPTSNIKFSITDVGYCSIFNALNNIPGNGYTLGTASMAYDHTGAKLPSNTSAL